MRPSRRPAPRHREIPLPGIPCPCCGEKKLVLVLPAEERDCDTCGLPTQVADLRGRTCRWCLAPRAAFRLAGGAP